MELELFLNRLNTVPESIEFPDVIAQMYCVPLGQSSQYPPVHADGWSGIEFEGVPLRARA